MQMPLLALGLSSLVLCSHSLQAQPTGSGADATAAGWSSSIPPVVQQAFGRFRASALKADDQFLASDLLEGRGPGTRGDALAMEYIAAQFAAAGLEPGGDEGTFFQKIALLGLTLDPAKSSLLFSKPGAPTIGPLK